MIGDQYRFWAQEDHGRALVARGSKKVAIVRQNWSTGTGMEEDVVLDFGNSGSLYKAEKRAVLKVAHEHGFSQQDAERVWRDLRRWQNEEKRREWFESMDPAIAKWCMEQIAIAQEGLECCDNVRAANKRKSAQVRRYKRQRRNGCCGSRDWESECPIDGATYLLGFNFGH